MTVFLRTYTLASLVLMVLAGVAMFLHQRSVMIDGVEAIAETSSVTAARLLLHPIRTQLAGYVEAANQHPDDPTAVAMPESLHAALAELIHDSRVVRVKVYDRRGTVIFSTQADQIGDPQEENEGFATAMTGKVAVELVYRDTFNAFDRATEEDNLVQIYFPVRARPTSPVIGVFETYTDVNALVIQAERSELTMLVGTVVGIVFIYGLLMLLVYRAHGQIEAQQQLVAEKNAVLEQLSRESLRREQDERRRLAVELHEGLAQSLSAVALALENARGNVSATREDMLSAVTFGLRDAIGHARAIAVHLHPPSLDQLGLAAALRELCSEFAEQHPKVRCEQEILVEESIVPAPLKATVFRIVATLLSIVGGRPEITRIKIAIRSSIRALTLSIADDAEVLVAAAQDVKGVLDPHSPFGEARERVMVSGGAMSVVRETGAPAVRFSWLL